MSHLETTPDRAVPEPLPPNLTSVQPGGGVCYSLELAWGRLRRWYLRTFWPGYVRRMAELRTGDATGAPHEILDPRDLKYCRNQCTAGWSAEHDPFVWRNYLGLIRWGLGEVLMIGTPLLVVTVAFALAPPPYLYLTIVPGIVLWWLLYFFRDPPRDVPLGPGLIVAPCDGKVVEVAKLEHDEFIGGPAVRIGIFLSIFNVHVNRMPLRGRVIRMVYSPGQFMSATNPESTIRNENLWIGFEEEAAPHRRFIVRQIAGMIARRIVCALRSGEVAERAAKFGMIKLGSRTELILPATDDLRVDTYVGQVIRGASMVLARYVENGTSPETDHEGAR